MIWKNKNLIIKDYDEDKAGKLLESLPIDLLGSTKNKKFFNFKRTRYNFFLVISSTSKDGSLDIVNTSNLILFMPPEIRIHGIAENYSSATEIVKELTEAYLISRQEADDEEKTLSMREFYNRIELFEG